GHRLQQGSRSHDWSRCARARVRGFERQRKAYWHDESGDERREDQDSIPFPHCSQRNFKACATVVHAECVRLFGSPCRGKELNCSICGSSRIVRGPCATLTGAPHGPRMSTTTVESCPDLLSLAVHEFRTPASVIGGYLRMLQRDVEPLTPRQRKMVDEA